MSAAAAASCAREFNGFFRRSTPRLIDAAPGGKAAGGRIESSGKSQAARNRQVRMRTAAPGKVHPSPMRVGRRSLGSSGSISSAALGASLTKTDEVSMSITHTRRRYCCCRWRTFALAGGAFACMRARAANQMLESRSAAIICGSIMAPEPAAAAPRRKWRRRFGCYD